MSGPLLPSLQAADVRRALTDYLSTTFALTDEDVRRALEAFLGDPADGIFRGPYARLRLPFRPADGTWSVPLDWWPTDFTPHVHQARAFGRLSSKHERPRPTLVTTGTGSGKTEAFLVPVLDHALRARARGQRGVKALVLYPMNALANDQAGRLAAMLTADPRLGGLTAGLYTGEQGPKRTKVSKDGLITERAVLRSDPPDLLLTNYKMLDQLLLRANDTGLWEGAPESLTYLVLDEFHTYDGAQGTDVAMLLRRLGSALGIARPDAPLGDVVPVATSATLGGGTEEGADAMRAFAATVFGTAFPADAVIREERVDVDDWLAEAASGMPRSRYAARTVSGAADLAETLRDAYRTDPSPLATVDALIRALFVRADDAGQDLGPADARRLRTSAALPALVAAHPFTRRLLDAASRPASLHTLAQHVLPDDPSEGHHDTMDVVDAHLGLLSVVRAQAPDAAAGRRLLDVQVQMWVREVSRVDRRVSTVPAFRWFDDGAHGAEPEFYLPALYCRHCGRSGWGALRTVTGASLDLTGPAVRAASVTGDKRFRALLSAPGEAAAAAGTDERVAGLRWLDTRSMELATSPAPDTDPDDSPVVPVLVDWDDSETARQDTCPSCRQVDAIRFLGSGISTLTSVTLSTLFGSPHLADAEKKALLFTDSVQDAAHTAGFVQARSHTLSLRAALREVVTADPLTLPDLADAVRDASRDPIRRYRIVPPALVDRQRFTPYWAGTGTAAQQRAAARRVGTRLEFDLALEFGLSSRTGRTLELTGSVVASVDTGSPETVVRVARGAIQSAREQHSLAGELDVSLGTALDDRVLRGWVRGVLERMRTQGGIHHRWLEAFVNSDGNRWFLTGGRGAFRDDGMPSFPTYRPAPSFPTTRSGAEGLDGISGTSSWYARWAQRQLKVTPRDGALLTRALLDRAAEVGWIASVGTASGAVAYRLEPDRVTVALPDAAALAQGGHALRCRVCRTVTPGSLVTVDDLDGAACLRQDCIGRLARAPRDDDYYRGLYASRDMRRVVAREHTSLLPDAERLQVEDAFKHGTGPDVPNVLAATPTLELGIDIGDLSTVMLNSLPRSVAAYVQRVGRAGRLTGNALALAYVRGRGRNVQRLTDPLSLIDGAVRPPATYLDAIEILQRQYVAWLVDRRARTGAADPPHADALLSGGWDPGTWIGDLLADARAQAEAHTTDFLALFGGLVRPDTAEVLRMWAGAGAAAETVTGLEDLLHRAARSYHDETSDLTHRESTLADMLPGLHAAAEQATATDDDKRDHRLARAELRFLKKRRAELRQQFWVAALEERGVLPNYTLLDDGVTLGVALRWTDQDTGEFQEDQRDYHRGSALALTEWAPGAVFYAQASAIRIDAVDVGTDIDATLQTWRLCARCGWSSAHRPSTGPEPVPDACPRCGDTGIRDTGQALAVLPLERVSAQISRDEAAISDRRDDRERTPFTVVAAVDIDPDQVSGAWQLPRYPFGAEYVRQADIRWVNVGRTIAQGQERILGGVPVRAPLFTLCPGCGVVPAAQNRDEPSARHRAWCPHRRRLDVAWRDVALGRTLRTQAVRMLIPPQFTLDLFAGPSFRAALLLGLREVLGGEPDHLAVLEVHVPVEGQDRLAILLHDTVPGGTGYLADFARPDRVRELLNAALRVLRSCPCADSGLLACAECLLPFTPPFLVDVTSRARAEQMLAEVVAGGEPGADGWGPVPVQSVADIPLPSPESHLEQRFRAALVTALRARGAQVREEPQLLGTTVHIGMPGARHRRWTLRPQVIVGTSRPDFELLADDPTVPRVYVFTDGQKWHATPDCNRLADDAEKRAVLRDLGHVVWAVTADDVDVFERLQQGGSASCVGAGWFTPPLQARLALLRAKAIPAGSVGDDLLGADAVTQLLAWITDPDPAAWTRVASGLALAFHTGADRGHWARNDLPALAASRLGGVPEPAQDPAALVGWSWQHAGVALAAATVAPPQLDVGAALVVDDSAAVLATDVGELGWRMWLALSNVLGQAERSTVVTTLSQVTTGAVPDTRTAAAPARPDRVESGPLPDEWQTLMDGALSDPEKALLWALADAGASPPEQGYELGDGRPVDLAWPDRKLIVVVDVDPGVEASVAAEGWRLLPPDPDAVVAALNA